MADFVNEFWHWFITIPVVGGLLYCWVLTYVNTSAPKKDGQVETMGHVWDEDLEEYNNPLPGWWRNMFYITLVFAGIYLALYPGLGAFQGYLDWSSKSRYENEVAAAEASYAPLYQRYLETESATLKADPEAMATAKRLFSTNCAVCHGVDARGTVGFPNLVDEDWIFGGDYETVKKSITEGRVAVMPPWGTALGESGVDAVAEYVYSLNNEPVNPHYLEEGKKTFETVCIACHGVDGKGNPALGASNLTDDIWLYGGSLDAIRESIELGRNGAMPAFSELLDESKIHLITTWLAKPVE